MTIKCPHCGMEHLDEVEACPATGKELGIAFRVAGRKIGKYTVERLIGEGGMGAVFEAKHESLGKTAALKFLHPRFLHDREILKRFTREAKAAAKIGHENIIDIYDIGQDDETGSTYLVMEFLEGKTLGQLIEEKGPLPTPKAVDYMLQVLSALHASHTLGIIHRDLKPDNIFLTLRGSTKDWVKVLDFGTAKIKHAETVLTGRGTLLGTPHYMAPELLEAAGNFDHRVDLYACGIILYQCMTGKLPFDAPSMARIYFAIMNDTPKIPKTIRPDIPDDLSQIILKSFARHPDARYENAVEMATALEPFSSGNMTVKDELEKGEELAKALKAQIGTFEDFPKTPPPRDVIVKETDTVAQFERKRRSSVYIFIALFISLLLALIAALVFFW